MALEETSTSGYLWRVGEVPEGIEYLESVFEPPSLGMPLGAGGHRRFVFLASNQGTFVLTFELRREREEKPLRDHEVRVDAGDPN